jgi:hypothetical protein
MKKYQYSVVRIGAGEMKLIGPLEGIRETRKHQEDTKVYESRYEPSNYPYVQVLNGIITHAFQHGEIYDTDEPVGV